MRPKRACNPTRPTEWCVPPQRQEALQRAAATDDAFTRALLAETCWVSRLFGAPWLAARVQVADLPVDPTTWNGRYEVRDSIAIDRDTETARTALKHDYEVVAGTEFRLRLRVDSDEPARLDWSASAFASWKPAS